MPAHATGRRSGRTISSTCCASPRLSRPRALFFTSSATTESSHAGSAWERRESRRSAASDRKRECEFAPTYQSPDDHGTQFDLGSSHIHLAPDAGANQRSDQWTTLQIKNYTSDGRATVQMGWPLIDVAENEARNL